MMSISTIRNAAYYESGEFQADEYYENDSEQPGRWVGAGAESLGLHGEVEQGQLLAMMQGYHPGTGEELATNAGEDHRPGWDCTFSAPKSVSALWAVADNDLQRAIEQAQQQAVDKAMAYADEHVAFIRRGHAGGDLEPANLIAATYSHTMSRALDPQLHTHTTVASHGIGKVSGDVRSIDSRQLYTHQKAMGAVYRAELAAAMQELGVSIERDGESFKLAGSNEALCQEWSKRREQVEANLEAKGTAGAKASEAAALANRPTKQEVNLGEVMERWHEEAQAHDFSVEQVMQAEAEVAPEFDAGRILGDLTDGQAVFNNANLHTAIAQELQGVGGADELQTRIEDMQVSGELINLGNPDGQGQAWTTREILELERGIIDFAKTGKDRNDWAVSEQAIEQAIANKEGISAEQQAALRHVCGAGQVVNVTGAAGVGKSFMLAAAKDAFEASGYRVIGCSLSGKAAAELQSGSGIESQTIHSLMHEIDSGKRELRSNDVLVMDEASMTDTRLFARVKDAQERAGAKLITVGDQQQIQSVGAGGVFGKLCRELGSAEILEVRRQQVEWQKQAANDLRNGHAMDALAAYKAHDALHIDSTTASAHERMVERWMQCDAVASEKLMIAGRRQDVAALNKLAREALKTEGKLGPETTVATTDRDGNSHRIKVAEGERLRLTKNDKALGVMNGDLATVTSINIDAEGRTTIGLELDRKGPDGEHLQRTINADDYTSFMHGYCVTAHASQGATVDQVFFYTSSFSSKQLAYVAASRHRLGCEIFASAEEVGKLTDQEIDKLAKAQGITEEQLARIERNLVKGMGRDDEKLTAIELAERAGLDVDKALDAKSIEAEAKAELEQREDEEQEQRLQAQERAGVDTGRRGGVADQLRAELAEIEAANAGAEVSDASASRAQDALDRVRDANKGKESEHGQEQDAGQDQGMELELSVDLPA